MASSDNLPEDVETAGAESTGRPAPLPLDPVRPAIYRPKSNGALVFFMAFVPAVLIGVLLTWLVLR